VIALQINAVIHCTTEGQSFEGQYWHADHRVKGSNYSTLIGLSPICVYKL